jgi:hypothetical protein
MIPAPTTEGDIRSTDTIESDLSWWRSSAAAPHDSGQAAGVQEHRGKRKGHEGGSGVQQGEGKRVKGEEDTTTSGTSESGERDDTGSEGRQGREPPGMTQGSACTGNDGAQTSSNAGESQGERSKHRSGARERKCGRKQRETEKNTKGRREGTGEGDV